MNETDRRVLERIGYKGVELAQVLETAGGDYDIDALIRTGYVGIHRERLGEQDEPLALSPVATHLGSNHLCSGLGYMAVAF